MSGWTSTRHFDVVITGGGLAGLALARHLLLQTDKTILLLDRRTELPGPRQKVGEATVQVSGYYYSKVLDLEEHLLREHFLKYNLRFYWKTPGLSGDAYEHYSQAYIRPLSNIPTYQLDRNKIEAEMFRLCLENPKFTFAGGLSGLDIGLEEGEKAHRVSFNLPSGREEVTAGWVVDASGRNRVLVKQLGLKRANPIHHGTSFAWVDGLVNIEKLTGLSQTGIRLRPDRAQLGHLPVWLATNHFMGPGFWFWTIPLQGLTSLGLVFDHTIFPRERVAGPEKLLEWVCEEFPLFARDLPHRRLVDHGGYRDYSYDCVHTMGDRWALTGEAGRFSDPLYSPGGDLISYHNTLIADLIKVVDPEERATKARTAERIARAVYEGYVPSFSVGYHALEDQEGFFYKYAWELTVYFAFYTFPFINDIITDPRFSTAWLTRFARLGPINSGIQQMVVDWVRWKKAMGVTPPAGAPRFADFMETAALARSEKTFYRVGIEPDEARAVLNEQLGNLEEMARWICARIACEVLDDERVLTDRAFVEGIDITALAFTPEAWAARWSEVGGRGGDRYPWSFDPRSPEVLLRSSRRAAELRELAAAGEPA